MRYCTIVTISKSITLLFILTPFVGFRKGDNVTMFLFGFHIMLFKTKIKPPPLQYGDVEYVLHVLFTLPKTWSSLIVKAFTRHAE